MQNQPGGAKVYEMQWDCKFCGTKKLLGKTHRYCPNCGAQQDPTWRYFPSDSEKVAVQDHVFVGADKICSACKSLNSAKAEFCGNCGSPMTKAAQAQSVGERIQDEGVAFETENLKERKKGEQFPGLAPNPKPQAAPKKSNRLWVALLILIPLIIGGVIFAFTRTTTSNAFVTGFRWERAITVETLSPVPSNSLCTNMPLDAYGVDRRYEQVGSHQEPDGETCRNRQIDQGDGTFREEQVCETNYKSVPDYDYVCYYTINRWINTRAATSQGDKSLAPFWADPNLRSGSCLGCERESGRDEDYYLIFKGDGDPTFECAVPLDQWDKTRLESAFTIQIGTILKNIRCDTLKPAG